MKVTASTVVPLPSAIIKMEDRKRAAGQNIDDLAPPTKRQAVNGSSKASADSDMPWKEMIEEYQKDAIYRQMLEYRREKATLESQLRDVQKKSVDHDDHLRVVDAWWSQLLEEVTILSKNIAPHPSSSASETPFPTALRFKNSTDFADHLSKKSREIKSKINELFSNLSAASGQVSSPELEDLQKSLTTLLASQKEQLIKCERLRTEKEELGERLETASLRYLKAEKKLDRLKSEPVAKLEAQAIASSSGGPVESENKDNAMNGIEHTSAQSEATQVAYQEARSEITKQKEQLDNLMGEVKTLTDQLTTANSKLTNLSDDDYARTDLFKTFRSQHEDVIKRINHLEATNIQLREEAEKLQAERTAFRNQLERESETVTGEIESQLQRVEADLTRIRSARDELLADQSTRKAHQEQEKGGVDQMKELCGAKDDRITSLESEIERLRTELGERPSDIAERPDLAELDVEELRTKYAVLEQSFSSVNNELPAMEKAYKRSMALASKKVMDFTSLEEKVTMLIAEKTKADQKYFAARKDMDIRIGEVRALRAQNAKSSEIISSLKDVESSNRALLVSLEKQLSEMRQGNSLLSAENKKLASMSAEATSKLETLRTQVTELSTMLKSKDASYSAAKQHIHSIEVDLGKLQTRYEHAVKERDTWKAKSLSNQSADEEMLRALALCTVCRKDFKNTVLKGCGHIFCNSCVEDRIASRYRKCPNCSKAFDKMDVMTVHM